MILWVFASTHSFFLLTPNHVSPRASFLLVCVLLQSGHPVSSSHWGHAVLSGAPDLTPVLGLCPSPLLVQCVPCSQMDLTKAFISLLLRICTLLTKSRKLAWYTSPEQAPVYISNSVSHRVPSCQAKLQHRSAVVSHFLALAHSFYTCSFLFWGCPYSPAQVLPSL